MFFVRWNLVDDGTLILKSLEINHALKSFDFPNLLNILIEKDIGRFRPFYYLFYWLIFLIGGKVVSFYFLVHFLLLGSIVFLIYKIGNTLFDKNPGFWASFLFLISSLNADHWYRLGPQEPILLFGLLISLYSFLMIFQRKNITLLYYVLSFLFLPAALLTKETSIAFIIPLSFLFIYIWLERNNKSFQKKYNYIFLKNYFLFAILISSIVFMISNEFKNDGDYTRIYSLTINLLRTNLTSYFRVVSGSFFPIFPIGIVLAGIVWLKNMRKIDQTPWVFFWLVWFLSFLAILLPWPILLGRYLIPSLVGICLLMGYAMGRFEALFKNSIIRNTFLIASVFFFTVQNISPIINAMLNTISGTRTLEKVLDEVAFSAPKNSKVYFNFKESGAVMEVVYETDLHLRYFKGRPDLMVEYLSNKQIPSGWFVISAFVSNNYLLYKEEDLEKKLNLKKEKSFDYNFYTLNDFSLRRIKRLLVNNESVDLSTIVKSQKNNWQIYRKI